MIVTRLRASVVTDPYSGLPTGEDWSDPQKADLPGYLVGWQQSNTDQAVNRTQTDNVAQLIRPGGVPEVEVLPSDRIRALGNDWTVDGHARRWEYADLLGTGVGGDAGTVWNLTLKEG